MEEQVRIEDSIDEMARQLDEDIISMPLNDLRRQLVSTSLSFKGERIRTQDFQQKLDGALRQLDKKDAIA